MATELKLFGAVAAFGLAYLAGNYAYFRGFDDGADASLCVFALQNLPQEEAMNERSCKAITGLKPPPRIFPGRNGDEPTIWSRTSSGGSNG